MKTPGAFLNYSEVNGIQLPWRTPNHWKTDGTCLLVSQRKDILRCQNENMHIQKTSEVGYCLSHFLKVFMTLPTTIKNLPPTTEYDRAEQDESDEE